MGKVIIIGHRQVKIHLQSDKLQSNIEYSSSNATDASLSGTDRTVCNSLAYSWLTRFVIQLKLPYLLILRLHMIFCLLLDLKDALWSSSVFGY